MKPPAAIAAALDQWLAARGLPRVVLMDPLGATNQMQVRRLFTGESLLSAEQRSAIEEFTEGVITVAMLEGRARAPKESKLKPPKPAAPPTTETAGAPGDEDVLTEALGDEALAALVDGMRKAPPGSAERRRCAQLVREYVTGKARQAEKAEVREAPVLEAALIAKLQVVEQRLRDPLEEKLEGGSGI